MRKIRVEHTIMTSVGIRAKTGLEILETNPLKPMTVSLKARLHQIYHPSHIPRWETQRRKPDRRRLDDPSNNASFRAEIGSENDPGRVSGNVFQRQAELSPVVGARGKAVCAGAVCCIK